MADSDVVGKIVAQIEGDESGFHASLQNVQKDLKKTDSEVTSFVEKIKKKLESVKEEGGRRSGLGELGETLAGAGAVAGVAIVGELLEHATEKAAELSEQFRQGKVDASGLAVGIGESLPIIGSFVTAGQNIREMFTGQKAAIEEVNKDIALGNALMTQRAAIAESMHSNLQGYANKTEDIQDQTQLQGAKPKEKQKLEVEIQYKTNERSLAEGLEHQKQERLKQLQEEEKGIEESYKDRNQSDPKVQSERREQTQNVQQSYDKDVAKLTAAAAEEGKALDAFHTKAAEVAAGTKAEMDKLSDSIAKTLAVTDTEKVKAYNQTLLDQGYSAKQAADLTGKYQESLKADKLAEYKKSLQDINKELSTTGDTARATALQTAAWEGADAKGVASLAKAYDHLAARKAIADLSQQASSFGVDPLDKLKNSEEFKHADKAEQDRLIKLTLQVTGQESAQQLHDSLKQINEDLKTAGESDIRKQIDQMRELAAKAGESAQMVGKIAAAERALNQIKVKDFVKQEKDQASDVGLSAPDKAVQNLKTQGVTDKGLLADAWQAAATVAGAELKQSLMTPFEKFKKDMSELDKLHKSGAIDNQTYARGVNKDQNDLLSTVQTSSVEDAFKSNLTRQLAGSALFGANPEDAQKNLTVATNTHGKKVDDNTKALHENTKAVKSGGPARAG